MSRKTDVEKELKDKKSLLNVFLKWCQDVTLGGVPNIVRSRHHIPSLVFWSIMFSTCLGLSIYMVASLVQEYNEYEVVTTDRIVSYDELKLPVLTFCNENPFLNPNANKYLNEYFYEKYGMNMSTYKQILEHLGPDQAVKESKRALYNLMNPNVSDTIKKSIGYLAEDTFLSISFNEDPMNASQVSEWFFDPVYGNCFRIDINFINITREGYGLFAEVFTGLPYEYNSYMYEPSTKGIRIEIKDADNYPYVYKSILAPASLVNLFTLTKKSSQLLPKPYSKCDSMSLKNLPLVEEMTRQGIPYDRGLCSIFALQNWTLHNYGCHNLLYPRMSFDQSSPPCLNESVLNLISSHKNANNLINQCPFDCDGVTFDFFYSNAKYPAKSWYLNKIANKPEYFERIFQNIPSFETFKLSYSMFIIVFEKLVTEEVSEKPKIEFLDLISNIGGTIGLFLGLSLLTATEILELVFELIVLKFRVS